MRSRELTSIESVCRSGFCLSCGSCTLDCTVPSELEYVPARGRFEPRTSGVDRGALESLLGVCPGYGYDIATLGEALSDGEAYHPDLGHYDRALVTHSNDPEVLARASSGGVMTALAIALLESGEVDGVVCTRFAYGTDGPIPESTIARERSDLLEAQGSKYCPVDALSALLDARGTDQRLAFIGTPCQVAAIRLWQERDAWFRDHIACTIANFCGGYRDLRHMRAIITRQGVRLDDVVAFRFRGGGQPGSLRIESRLGAVRTRPYPSYGSDAGHPKLHRCRLCVDATAELADFACGDAWLDRFLKDGHPWSIVLTRTRWASTFLDRQVESGALTAEPISPEDIRRSQATNLRSKKERQGARWSLYRSLGRPLPWFARGAPQETRGRRLEAKVYTRHLATDLLERLGIYSGVVRGLRWVRSAGRSRGEK